MIEATTAPIRHADRLPSTVPGHVYVHVPFCARRCTYCDFAIAVRRVVPVAEYVAALRAELDVRLGAAEPWPVETLYLGGGTPSRLGPDGVAAVVQLLAERLSLRDGAEVTLEANPEDVTDAAVARWRTAGVNRLSLGGQSFDDRVLAWMHRGHSGADIVRAVETARSGGLTNFSFDLIFAVPPELRRVWPADVERMLALDPPHVSLYGLTVEPSTPLARLRDRGSVSDAPEESYETEFLAAHAALTGAGYDHYEVSNFARPGSASRHNRSYWTGEPYLGLGPSAHGFDGAVRRWNVAAYADWARRALAGRDPMDDAETLTAANRMAELVYLGLRTTQGVVLTGSEVERARPWLAAGWATLDGDRLRLTALGWLRLDALAADLTLFRSRS